MVMCSTVITNSCAQDYNVPLVSGDALWPDKVNKLFYLFGGNYESTAELKTQNPQGEFQFWSYDTLNGTWAEPMRRDGSRSNVRWPTLGASVVSDAGLAY